MSIINTALWKSLSSIILILILRVVKTIVSSPGRHERLVCSPFNDFSRFNDCYDVRLPGGRQTMSNSDARAPFTSLVQGLLHYLFEGGGGETTV